MLVLGPRQERLYFSQWILVESEELMDLNGLKVMFLCAMLYLHSSNIS